MARQRYYRPLAPSRRLMPVSADRAGCFGPQHPRKSAASRRGNTNPGERPDCLLEEAGFEPSVPRDTPKFSTPAHVTCLTPYTRKSRREREPMLRGCGRLPRNRWFESGSLQRRVASKNRRQLHQTPEPHGSLRCAHVLDRILRGDRSPRLSANTVRVWRIFPARPTPTR